MGFFVSSRFRRSWATFRMTCTFCLFKSTYYSQENTNEPQNFLKKIFVKSFFLIPIAFPNNLTASIISGSTVEKFFYEDTKFQRSRIKHFCVADFQIKVISACV